MKKHLSIIIFLFSINTFSAEPYFVSADCKSTKKIISQDIKLSFTTTPARYDTIKDSTFSCNADECSWSYTIKRIDTLQRENTIFNYTVVDSAFFVDTLNFSFFDAENDSCKFIIAGLDSAGNKVYADSIWGDIASRPGVNKVIYFFHRKPYKNILPGIIQLSSLTDTILDTIQYKSMSVFNLITDSSFYAKLNGGWKKIYQQSEYCYVSCSEPIGSFVDTTGGCFFNSKEVSGYNKDKSVIYTTTLDGYLRDGWGLKKENFSTNEHLTQIIVNKDTLITCAYYRSGISRSYYTYVYIRDTSIKFSDLPVKRYSVQRAEIFKVSISSNQIASVISFNLPQRQKTSLSIFDLTGRMVIKCLDQTLEAGSHQIQFKPKSLSCKNLHL